MKPYFERDGITLFCEDCLEILPRLEAGSVDLLLTDPPYGVAYESGWSRGMFSAIAGDESVMVGEEALRRAKALLEENATLYVFGNMWNLKALGYTACIELIWDKCSMAMGNLELEWGPCHEYIQFASNRDPRSRGGLGRKRKGSIIRYSNRSEVAAARHPTEKPVPLLRELIESSSRFGDLILDPFAGVGSTGVAAMLEGRRSILIEIEERYAEIAANRLSQAVLPLEGVAA